jgi:hypothetical protein
MEDGDMASLSNDWPMDKESKSSPVPEPATPEAVDEVFAGLEG